ncbi:recombinase family protein [Quadrisphaera sp. INWT6]|nr:recombinase family protein [Quadrisphaera sp. INWT6]
MFSDAPAPAPAATARPAGAPPAAFRPVPTAAVAPGDGATSTVHRDPSPQPAGLKVGYARVSTTEQDLTAHRTALAALGVEGARVYVDHGLTGANRARPGLREAMAACGAGDTLVVTKLDRLARSLPDARDIVADLTERGVGLQLGATVHDPTDPVGRLLFNVLAMVAEFEGDLIRARTREGMTVAKAKGRLRGKPPKLKAKQEAHLVALWLGGEHTGAELAELFGVARSTVYRAVQRAGSPTPQPGATGA